MEASEAGEIKEQPRSKVESALWPGAKLRNTKSARQVCEMCACAGTPRVSLVGRDHTVDNREEGDIRRDNGRVQRSVSKSRASKHLDLFVASIAPSSSFSSARFILVMSDAVPGRMLRVFR